MPPRQPTVTSRFAQAIRQAAERLGIQLPVQKNDTDRVPLQDQDQLWEAFCAGTEDPLAGLRLGLELQAGHLDLPGLLLMSCNTYGEALRTFLEYYPIVGEGGVFELKEEGGQVSLLYHSRFQVRVAERVEAVVGAIMNLGLWNTGGALRFSRVDFAHSARTERAAYESLLKCPVHFNQADNRLCLSREMLDLPLIQSNAAMRDQLRHLADDHLARLGAESLAQQVAFLLRTHPSWGKERVGAEFGISGRHLVRRLAEEGTTFRDVRDSVLLALAKQKLEQDGRIADIAEALGFSDESAFAKAFRRWTGISPGQYRKG